MMRLVGATSPDVHGLTTQAGEVIGEISLGGTLAFLVFVGLPAGFLSGGLYALVAPLLPSGRARGVALGVLLLVLFATRIDPLQAESIDFLLLEPAWLAVLGFSALALFQGMLVAALAPPPKPVARSRSCWSRRCRASSARRATSSPAPRSISRGRRAGSPRARPSQSRAAPSAHGSASKRASISRSSAASIAISTRSPTASGPPNTMKPSSTSSSM